MRVFKNNEFKKWSKKQGIEDKDLLRAVREMNDGLYDANLGGSVYKKRLAYGGKGKRGGVRTILAFRVRDKAFFMYGFSKNKLANITEKDEVALKALAEVYLNLTNKQLNAAVDAGNLMEVKHEKIDS
ncbi:MAG: hypothetical protein A3F13_07195 [Gammaproteobacteria bacterium RIFCSPHIGHO2_12_FULL_40_19]|nr:MAG: hypothetical protein A3F13_07195 [Gammaproteobacteria bacterium RIFCSPHIGHO2_12_FULL_40_19]HLB43467.1 type II toxin-antitoxin system RelE/ParE family toxin [Gammaproteobacteria bacterium]